jgi:hypothetical protein
MIYKVGRKGVFIPEGGGGYRRTVATLHEAVNFSAVSKFTTLLILHNHSTNYIFDTKLS